MIRASLKSLLSRKFRLILSALAVVLGVSFVSGAFVLTDTMSKAFDGLFSTVNAGTSVTVQADNANDPNSNEVGRTLVPGSLVGTVKSVDGVRYAEGSIYGFAQLVGKDGKALGGNGPPTAGVNWGGGADTPTSIITLRSGRGPQQADEMAIDAGLADQSGYRIGEQATVLTEQGQHRFTIVGIYGYHGNSSLGGSTTVAFTDAEAQRLMTRPGEYDSITVAAADGVTQDQLRDRISPLLPHGLQAITGKQSADQQSSDVKSGLKFFTTFLLVFAGVSLFVGAFLIFNTFSMLIAQRSKELALMRALGASRGQVLRSVLVESLLVGAVAALIGLGVGIGLAIGLRAALSAIGVDLPTTGLVISARTVVVALLVGIVVTVVAALAPARKASSVPPIAALREVAVPDASLRRITVIGAVALLLGIVGIVLRLAAGAGFVVLVIGAVLVILGVVALSPAISVPLTSALGTVAARALPGRLGRQNAMRNPRRTASTAAALMIGLALVSAIGVLGQSVKASISGVINSTIGSDFILNGSYPGFSTDVVSQVERLPGVSSAVPLFSGPVDLDGSQRYVTAVPRQAITDHSLALSMSDGSATDLGPGRLLLSTTAAKALKVRVGSTVQVRTAKGGTDPYRVVGVYRPNQVAGDYVVDSSVVKQFTSPLAFAALVDKDGSASAATVRRELDRATADQATITVQDKSDFASATGDQVNQLIAVVYVLLALSVVIAVLGIVNTLALSVLERTRELGLLRAIGMSRKQIRRMVRVESVIIAVFGAILGLVVGVLLGAALSSALKAQGITVVAVPWLQLVIFLVLAALAGVLAAVLPGRRAAKMNVLAAIATE